MNRQNLANLTEEERAVLSQMAGMDVESLLKQPDPAPRDPEQPDPAPKPADKKTPFAAPEDQPADKKQEQVQPQPQPDITKAITDALAPVNQAINSIASRVDDFTAKVVTPMQQQQQQQRLNEANTAVDELNQQYEEAIDLGDKEKAKEIREKYDSAVIAREQIKKELGEKKPEKPGEQTPQPGEKVNLHPVSNEEAVFFNAMSKIYPAIFAKGTKTDKELGEIFYGLRVSESDPHKRIAMMKQSIDTMLTKTDIPPFVAGGGNAPPNPGVNVNMDANELSFFKGMGASMKELATWTGDLEE